MSDEVVEVLGYGTNPQTGAPVRRVRLADGSTATQQGRVVSIERTITRADGTVEPGAPITHVQIGDAA
jgi:hypothetical protein